MSRKWLWRVWAVAFGDLKCSLFDWGGQVFLTIFAVMFAALSTVIIAAPDAFNDISTHEVLIKHGELAPGLKNALRAKFRVEDFDGDPEAVLHTMQQPGLKALVTSSPEVVVDVISDDKEAGGIRLDVITKPQGFLSKQLGRDVFNITYNWTIEQRRLRVINVTHSEDLLKLSNVRLVDVDDKKGETEKPASPKEPDYRKFVPGAFAFGLLLSAAMFPVSTASAKMGGGDMMRGGYEPMMSMPVRAWEFILGRMLAIIFLSTWSTVIFEVVVWTGLHLGRSPVVLSYAWMFSCTLAIVATAILLHFTLKTILGSTPVYRWVAPAIVAVIYGPITYLAANGTEAANSFAWYPYLGQAAVLWSVFAQKEFGWIPGVISMAETIALCGALTVICHKKFSREAYLFRD